MRNWLFGALLAAVCSGVALAAPQTTGKTTTVAQVSATQRPPAVIAAAAGHPVRVPDPTYRWRGLTVPVGACGAVVGGRAMVLPCADKRVVAYRRRTERRAAVLAAVLAVAAAILCGGTVPAALRGTETGHGRSSEGGES